MEDRLNKLRKNIERLEVGGYYGNKYDLKDVLVEFEEIKQLILHDVSSSDLIEINNAHIEDADDVDNYYVSGRVDKLWVTKKSFDNIKCINN